MRESVIEEYLRKQVLKLGGKAYKWSSMNNRGVPDRVCFFPRGLAYFVELKAPGKTPSPLQAKVIKQLRMMGHTVLVIDTKEKVDEFIHMVMEDMR